MDVYHWYNSDFIIGSYGKEVVIKIRPLHHAETIALLQERRRTMATGCGTNPECLNTFKTTAWEDNMRLLILSRKVPDLNTTKSNLFNNEVRKLKYCS